MYLAANLAGRLDVDNKEKSAPQPVVKEERRNLINAQLNDSSKCVRLEGELVSLRKSLQESYANYDSLELAYGALKSEMTRLEARHAAEMRLMAARIDDLAGKLRHSERALRLTKHRRRKSTANHVSPIVRGSLVRELSVVCR